MSDGPVQPEPVIEPMPEASDTPVSRVTPLISPLSVQARSYKGRFTLVYALLGLVALLAAAGFAALLVQGAKPGGAAWSTWKPSNGSPADMAGAIASHVGPQYRLAPGGGQLAAIQATDAPIVQTVPVEVVAVHSGSDYKTVSTKNTIVYTLCGLGTRCAIASGTPSQARARLLRSEALELALYTFKYVDGVERVIVHMPPPPEPNTNWALFFQQNEFSPELSRPLSQTIPAVDSGKKLVPASVEGNATAQTIERLTRPYWFTTKYQQAPDGNAILVLDPVITSN